MDAKWAHQSVKRALGDELAKRWGQIASIEARLSRSDGYLRKFCSGSRTIPLNRLFETLEVLEVDPGQFFLKALGTRVDPDGFVRDLLQPDKEAPILRRIEKATRRMEAGTPSPEGDVEAPKSATGAEELLAKVVRCSIREQRRRLRTARRYRTPGFARVYLGHLDRLRYDDPHRAAKLVEVVATDLVPGLACPRSEALDLQCRAITILSAAHRLMSAFPTAARAAVIALDLARRHELKETTALVLQRASYLLADHGQHPQALVLLREAFEIQFDLGSRVEMGKILSARGHMLTYMGELDAAVKVSEQALELLPGLRPGLRRCYLATYFMLAHVSEQQRDLERAEKWLAEAVDVFKQEGGINWAKLVWQRGRIAFLRTDYATAEAHLRQAHSLFEERGASSDGALLALDLTRVLLTRGKAAEAHDLALRMAAFLSFYRDDKIAEGAIAEYARVALEGKLTLALIDRLQPKLEGASARR